MLASTNVVSLPERYQDVHLEVDFTSATMSVDSRPLALTRKEYELLTLLVQNAGEIIPRNILLVRVWGYSPSARTRTLDVHGRNSARTAADTSKRSAESVTVFNPFVNGPQCRTTVTSP